MLFGLVIDNYLFCLFIHVVSEGCQKFFHLIRHFIIVSESIKCASGFNTKLVSDIRILGQLA